MIYVLCMIIPLLIWPSAWADARFLIPLIPFGWILLVKFPNKWIVRAVFLILMVSMIGKSLQQRQLKTAYDKEYLNICKIPFPNGSIVASRKPMIFSYYSGLKSMSYPLTTDTIVLKKALSQADYLIVEPGRHVNMLYSVAKNWKIVAYGNNIMVCKVP